MKELAKTVCAIRQPQLLSLIESIKELDDKIYNHYFEEKLNNIFKLEEELKLIQTLTPLQFKEYKNEHCPNIKSKHGLISQIFIWQEVYRKQIEKVVKYLKENKCHNLTEQQQLEASIIL